MTPINILGYALAIGGGMLGIIGALATASAAKQTRHFGFTMWLINSPLVTLSMIGIAFGWFEGINAAIYVPLNMLYFITALIGFKNTSEPSRTAEPGDFEECDHCDFWCRVRNRTVFWKVWHLILQTHCKEFKEKVFR